MSQPEFSVLRNLPARVRAVRKEMGLTQAQFATLGGVGLGAQHRYETGSAEPGAEYLARLAEAGVDVLHLLTGRRNSGPLLDEQTSTLIERFAHLDPSAQSALLTLADRAGVDRPTMPRAGPKQVFDPAVSSGSYLREVAENPVGGQATGETVSMGLADSSADVVRAKPPTKRKPASPSR